MKKLKLKLLKMLYNFCINRKEAYDRYADRLDDEIIKINAMKSRIFQPPIMCDFTDQTILDVSLAQIENEFPPQPENLIGNKIEWRKYSELEMSDKSLYQQWRDINRT